ncbi:hypothetical protein WN71_026100 [Streptomyces mangrovisoli]|uniref:Bacterial transcriptional activator domain-containing protein n=1 Tax=Streptomyces mangrovisoli TaxID=1428628 RepID=A0A1J4NS74_9ACTN|nr:hypothetical protein WN71_026100 [Streptomyces mangrovisoli]
MLPHDQLLRPIAPFTRGADGWWLLPDKPELLTPEQARHTPAPYPALATLGTTPGGGGLILVDLNRHPVLLLDGPAGDVTQICAALALELALAPWAGGAALFTVAFGQDLPALFPGRRIHPVADTTQALRELGERLLEAHQHPDTPQNPCLLLSAQPLDNDTARHLAALLAQDGPTSLTVVAPAQKAIAHLPHAPVLDAGDHGPQHLDADTGPIILQRLDETAYRQIISALAQPPGTGRREESSSADTRPRTPPGDAPCEPPEHAETPAPRYDRTSSEATDVPSPALPAAVPRPPASLTLGPEPAGAVVPPDAADAGNRPQAPQIRVLGAVEVDGIASTGHGPRTAQLAALLYFRPGRTTDAVCTDMDPHTPWTPNTLYARLHQLRRALGNDADGNPYVPRRGRTEDAYRLHPGIRCDWTAFQHLTRTALTQGTDGLAPLEQALQLVRGRPFGNRPLPWAEPLQQDMVTQIVYTAHTVAALRIQPGRHLDLTAARQAITIGLEADAGAEVLYRAWMNIEAMSGNRSGVHAAVTRVHDVSRTLGVALEKETEDLIHHLLSGSASGQGGDR